MPQGSSRQAPSATILSPRDNAGVAPFDLQSWQDGAFVVAFAITAVLTLWSWWQWRRDRQRPR